MSVAGDISDYLDFRNLIDLGLQVHHSEIPFYKTMVFSWIKFDLETSKGK